jgi:hypothetical protein
VARATLEGEVSIVRAAESLGVAAAELPAFMRVAIGAQVTEGQVLAEMKGLWGLLRSTVTAPSPGTVAFLSESTGHIGIRAESKMLDLNAYLSGLVVEVVEGRAVVIESQAAFVQGIFGVGGERVGRLMLLPCAETDQVQEQHIPADVTGAILVGGHSPSIGALRCAASRGAVGFVTGSLDDTTLREFVGHDIGVAVTGDEDVPMSLIITEGFGAIAMSARVIDILREVEGQESSINGATQVRAGSVRPEIVVPRGREAGGAERNVMESHGLVTGARVRMIRVPYFGVFGTVTELPHEPQRIETGAAIRVLRAQLDDGRSITVPRANVELV